MIDSKTQLKRAPACYHGDPWPSTLELLHNSDLLNHFLRRIKEASLSVNRANQASLMVSFPYHKHVLWPHSHTTSQSFICHLQYKKIIHYNVRDSAMFTSVTLEVGMTDTMHLKLYTPYLVYHQRVLQSLTAINAANVIVSP